ncbi:MAG: tRNA preQ1(34) S-adenosylmethionine ribosyltransferase-isomerase QueA [Patescibacteria group bacterium]
MQNPLEQYAYNLPDALMAKIPAEPRDSSKLLVYNTATDTITDARFYDLPHFIPTPSLLVMNDTKVIPARVMLSRNPLGKNPGKVEVLFLVNEIQPGASKVRGMVDRKTLVGDVLAFPDGSSIEAVGQQEHIFHFDIGTLGEEKFRDLLIKFGTTPLPKYIGETGLDENKLRERYQSVFAKSEGERSVAAPTASLHMTPEVLKKLQDKGVRETFVTLHVGMGTFAPVNEEQIVEKRLHKEWYDVSSAVGAINEAKENKMPIIAMGTTATRALESFGRTGEASGDTDIFILPGHEFQIASGLITNFHLPKTSLMALVDAFLKHKKSKRGILDLYAHAIEKGYRFYSFGDAMLII